MKWHPRELTRSKVLLVGAVAVVVSSAAYSFFSVLQWGSFASGRDPASSVNEWPQWSGDRRNHHNLTPERPLIDRTNVKDLRQSWSFKTPNSVVATPTYKDGVLYFTDVAKTSIGGLFSGGRLFAVDASSGRKLWSEEVKKYTQSELRNFSRSSPALSGNSLVIGDSINNLKFIAQSLVSYRGLPGSSVIAIDRRTGTMLWKTVVEAHFASRITMSPVIFENKVFVGVSSQESEIQAILGDSYKCCTFRGSMVALDLATGRILWKRTMIDRDIAEVAGAPVWGSSPPIDVRRRRIYVGTGNNYNASLAMKKCYALERLDATVSVNQAVRKCAALHDSAGNRFDALVALDLDSGDIVWSKKTMVYDAWNVGCGSIISPLARRSEKACPKPEGMDADFAQAPMLLTIELEGTPTDILVAGQKNGMFWAVRADTGETIWHAQVGPGGKLGGHQWGSATDGKTIFFQTTNMEHQPITLTAGTQKGKIIHGGFWGALDAKTGKLLWQTPDPATKFPLKGEGLFHILYGVNLGRGFFAAPMGALTYYNKLIFAGSLSGTMVALDATDGRILWSQQNKGSVVSAPSIVNDTLYWGVGYHMGFAGNEVLALGLK